MPTATIRKTNDTTTGKSKGNSNGKAGINRRGIDGNKYAKLLAHALPVAIRSEADHERMLAEIEKLMAKGEAKLTREENALLELLTQIVERYESTAYPADLAKPAELVAFLLEQRGLGASDLWPVLGSKGRVSEILSGKREVSKEQAKRLGEFFHVSPAAFFYSTPMSGNGGRRLPPGDPQQRAA